MASKVKQSLNGGYMLDILQQLSRVCYYAPIGVGLVSLEGQWTNVNPALSQMIGYTEEELIRASFQEFSHSNDLRQLLDRLQQLLRKRY
jgi:PAS domain S-box-containing protein